MTSKSKTPSADILIEESETNSINHEELAWLIIDKYFSHDPNILVKHHLESFNDFFNNKIYNIFKEKNPILIIKEQDETTKEYNYRAEIYIGGVDGKRLAVSGDSAGGNIATVITHIARDVGGLEIAFQLLVYPTTDYEFTSDSMIDNSEGYLLTTEMMRWFYGHYLNGDVDAVTDPRVSPLRADDLSDLPPAYIITAGYDPLRDQGNAYAEAMAAAGVNVELVHYEGMFHGFFGLESILDTAGEAIAHASAALRVALAVE